MKMHPKSKAGLDSGKDLLEAFKKLNTSIFRYIYLRINCQKELAQDLTQEVFEKAWKNREAFDKTKSSLKNWLFIIARNIVIDQYRKAKLHAIPYNEEIHDLAIEQDIDNTLMYEQIIQNLNKLSKEEKELIILRFIEGFSIREISEMIGKKYTATKISIYRALDKLRDTINGKK
ncbi:RNA polymerase sigma factor [Candidatus Dojkabacteria bacterium]|nr:RNA polymerase sigma factor [Candidatus Dojkabacteria bacterium]